MKAKSYELAESFVKDLKDLCEEYNVYSIQGGQGNGDVYFRLMGIGNNKRYCFDMYPSWSANDEYEGTNWYLEEITTKKEKTKL